MKSILPLGFLMLMNFSYADNSCSYLRITDTLKITTMLKNTSHDLSEHDEISLHYAASRKKANSNQNIHDEFIGDKLGEHMARLESSSPTPVVKVSQYTTEQLPTYTIEQAALYNKYLNVLLNERDSELNVTGTAADGVIFVLQGANPTDYLFLRSLKLSKRHGPQRFDLENELGDELTIHVEPATVTILKRDKLESILKQLVKRNDTIQSRLAEIKSMNRRASLFVNDIDREKYRLENESKSLEGKISYYADVLKGEISGVCEK